MKRYLRELYKKPDHHKKRFALLASGTITLFIFGIWSLAIFPPKVDQPLAGGTNQASDVGEAGPLQLLGNNLASSFQAIQKNFKELKSGLGAVNIEDEYEDLRDRSLDLYGQ